MSPNNLASSPQLQPKVNQGTDHAPDQQILTKISSPTPNRKDTTVVVFFGLPSSGKGTHARMVAERLGIPTFSMGDYFKEQVKLGTPQGKLAEPYMTAGILVPDEMTIEVIKNLFSDPKYQRGIVLDGFPRNEQQAKALEVMLRELGIPQPIVFEIQVDEVTAKVRMHERASSDGDNKRQDDNDITFEKRLSVYRKEGPPLRDFYKERGILHSIVGLGTKEEVGARVWQELEAINPPTA